MSYKPRYDSGLWKVICDECGREFKSNELRKRWDGLMVCDGDWEPRQPQDFVKAVADKMVPPFTRPEQSDQFVNFCTPDGISDIPYFAVPGCCIPGYISPAFDMSKAVPECNALYILVDEDVNYSQYLYGCNALVVDADLQLEGTIRIR